MLEMLQFCLATAEKLPAILNRKTFHIITTENYYILQSSRVGNLTSTLQVLCNACFHVKYSIINY